MNRKDVSEMKLLEIFQGSKKSIDGLPSIKYGIEKEDSARKKYCEFTGSTVIEVGIVIKDKFWWFGASPDGLILNQNHRPDNYGLLEIKCIWSCRDGQIENCNFLDKQGKLKKTHKYWWQIQLTAWVTGAKYAHLFLYTDHDCKLICVPLDTKFA